MINWKPDYKEFRDVLLNEYAVKILAIISRENRHYCAADMAKLFDMHISTAKKYLDLFSDLGFVEKEYIPDRPGKPTYYYPKSNQITITLDMRFIAESLAEKKDNDSFSNLDNPVIRERAYFQPVIDYTTDSKGFVKFLTLKRRTKAKRFVKQKVELSLTESQFMKYLPYPTMHAQPFLEICKRAGITDYFDIKSLVPFIEKLQKIGVIEVIDTVSEVKNDR